MIKEGNIILTGMPGSGKSQIGKILAQKLDKPFFDTDVLIEEEKGEFISDIFSKYGEIYFRDLETQKAKEVSGYKGAVVSTGGGMILRPQNMEYLRKSGRVFFIDRSLEDIFSTLDTKNRPLLKDNSENSLKKLYNERIKLYNDYADFIIVNDKNPEIIAEYIINIIKNEK